jgi:ribonuclease VapC
MVLDTSALLALLLDEPEAEEFRAAVEEDTTRLVSAATLLETALVVEARKGEPGGRELDFLVHKAEIVVVPVDFEQVFEARRAYRRFGKGRHAAGLNFGDLFAYALPARPASRCSSRARISPKPISVESLDGRQASNTR